MAKAYEGNGDLFEILKAWPVLLDRLKKAATPEEKLLARQAIRDAGILSPEKGFHLVASAVLTIAEPRFERACSEGRLKEIEDQKDAIKKAHGIDLLADFKDGPKEYKKLSMEWERIHNQFIADVFHEFGEHEMGNLYLNDPVEFERRVEKGYQLFGPFKLDDADDDTQGWE